MLFTSPVYLFLFLPACVFGYYALAGRLGSRWAAGWLIVASLFFYGWWNPIYLTLIVLSIGGNFAVGQMLMAWPAEQGRRRKLLAIAGVVANVAVLAYFKYFNFFIDNINTLSGADFVFARVILPLGISFFTFQKIAYIVDCYAGKVKRTGFMEFCLFVLFFPQLIAGPIVHHSDIIPQFRDKSVYALNLDNIAAGIALIILGLFKKLVLADNFAAMADPVFHSAAVGAEPTQFIFAWTAALAYTLQLYFDFSGYVDLAIGSARLFNIALPENFNSPYKAHNIVDFWRRWHMTLSRFLRDYVYIPLGGNRYGALRRYGNLFATMLVGGLWHGAAWTFVLWGALHGLYLIVNHAWQLIPLPAWCDRPPLLLTWANRLLTMLAVVVAWVFFRADSFAAAVRILTGMVSPRPFGDGAVLSPTLEPIGHAMKAFDRFNDAYLIWFTQDYAQLMAIALGFAVCWMLPSSGTIVARMRERRLGLLAGGALSATLGLAALATIFAAFRPTSSPFIYFNF